MQHPTSNDPQFPNETQEQKAARLAAEKLAAEKVATEKRQREGGR